MWKFQLGAQSLQQQERHRHNSYCFMFWFFATGPVLSKFISAFRELATYKELLRTQVITKMCIMFSVIIDYNCMNAFYRCLWTIWWHFIFDLVCLCAASIMLSCCLCAPEDWNKPDEFSHVVEKIYVSLFCWSTRLVMANFLYHDPESGPYM